MGIGVVLSRIPWKKILGPAIAEAARELIEHIKRRLATSKIIDQKIADLQNNDAQQADLISQLAKQAQGLSDGLHVIAARVALLLGISVAALLLAIVVAVKEFLF